MKEHAYEEAKERMHAEIKTDAKMFGEGELIGIVRGVLDNRQVDHKFRINHNNELEELYNFYDNGELFSQSEWVIAVDARLDEKGERIISGVTDLPEERDGTPINEWLRTVPARNLLEDITEIWDEMKSRSEKEH